MENKEQSSHCMLRIVSIEDVVENPYQPRKQFDLQALEELADSILSVGILHPPLAREAGDKFELISGERRFRAAKMAGLKEIPLMVRQVDNPVSAKAALIENVHRQNLNAIEIAQALGRLQEEFGYTQQELSDRIGMQRSSIANYLRLLGLDQVTQSQIAQGRISLGQAKVLLSVDSDTHRRTLLHQLLRKNTSVRELEKIAASLKRSGFASQGSKKTTDCYINDLEQKLQRKLGTKVTLESKKKGGSLTLHYYDLDDLDRLLQLLGVEEWGV